MRVAPSPSPIHHLYGSIDVTMLGIAVTLEGTIIHKSGLITGGRSTQDSGKKWEEKDIQGASSYSMSASHGNC